MPGNGGPPGGNSRGPGDAGGGYRPTSLFTLPSGADFPPGSDAVTAYERIESAPGGIRRGMARMCPLP